MRLKPISPSLPLRDSAPLDLQKDGCLIGSAPELDLPLPPADDLGRMHAVIRLQDGRCSLETLSAKGSVQVNGRRLGVRQRVELLPGDRLQVNQHSWSLETALPEPAVLATTAGAPLLLSAAAPDAAGSQAACLEEPETRDIFEGLLGGPGVVPVGAPLPPLPEGSESHILSDTRPTLLNHEDPEMMKRRDDIGDILNIEKHQT